MSLSWLPNTTQGRMVGDYISGSFVSGPAFPAIAVATAPTSGGSDCFTATPACNEATFTVQGGVSVSSGTKAVEQAIAGGSEIPTRGTVTAR